MEVVTTTDTLRDLLSGWRYEGDHIALVPTMGDLHDGQMSLVEIAREHAERVVVSIFAIPGNSIDPEAGGDLAGILERDKRRLKLAKTDLLFLPDVETVYPYGIDGATTVSVPALTKDLFGPSKSDDFDSVTSMVTRLFSLVQPDVAVFGQRDYQQQLVISRMAKDLSLQIKIICGPTVREKDGLAMSAMNRQLSEAERELAPNLYSVLEEIGRGLETGQRDYRQLEEQGVERLEALGFRPEYVSIRRAENLDVPDRDCDELVILASAWLSDVRLLDNLVVHI
ncbi:MAG: pantoate--beta-alanine ligase [Woeseiaceae bacterium]